jgi:hypothetical protein
MASVEFIIIFQTPAAVAANAQLLFALPLSSDTNSSDFFAVAKLLKSIVIDSAGGKVGGSPLSFLHPVKKPVETASINKIGIIFFIGKQIKFNI